MERIFVGQVEFIGSFNWKNHNKNWRHFGTTKNSPKTSPVFRFYLDGKEATPQAVNGKFAIVKIKQDTNDKYPYVFISAISHKKTKRKIIFYRVLGRKVKVFSGVNFDLSDDKKREQILVVNQI